MRVLITGAKGNFPAALIPRLEAAGHEMVLLDLEPMHSDKHTAVQADVRDAGALTAAMQGCDAVIHAMAYHGDMAGRRNYDDYYGVNVTGTHNVLLAMLRLGIKNLVFSSSEVVYGAGMQGRRVMDESVPCIPTHVYPLTKVLDEEMCRFYARQHGFRIAMLRYGCFVPADWKTHGMGRLTNWLDREDVAQANTLALDAVAAEQFECEAFLIHCHKPFQESDWPQLGENPEPIVEKYFPGALELLKKHDLSVPKIHTLFDISKAQRVLGYEPQYNFEQFLQRLQAESRETAS
jgi:nucleoside-diphosphate-sugar epimerase